MTDKPAARTHHAQVKMTPGERDSVAAAAAAAGLSGAAWVRQAIRDALWRPDRVQPVEIIKRLVEVRTALSKIGTNLNQIAKIANESRQIDGTALSAEIQALAALRPGIASALVDLRP